VDAPIESQVFITSGNKFVFTNSASNLSANQEKAGKQCPMGVGVCLFWGDRTIKHICSLKRIELMPGLEPFVAYVAIYIFKIPKIIKAYIHRLHS